jgi:Putative pectate lyase-like adhesive domain
MWVMRRSAALLVGIALGGACLVAVGAAPAAAATVSDEVSFRAAWTNPIGALIILAKDIKLSCARGGVAVRNSPKLLTVDGHGHTIVQACPNNGVLQQAGGGALRLRNLTITGGAATGPGVPPGSGGGGVHTGGDLVVTRGKITHNTASGWGGGIFGQRAVTLTRSVVSDNTSSNGGGGIWVEGNLKVTNSTIRNNNDAGTFGGGGISATSATASAMITNSTITGNTAALTSGGIGGGGIAANGSWTITNSTITGNAAGSGGGGGIVTAIPSQVTLVYTTVVDNTSSNGANVLAFNPLVSFGSVVALPQGSANCANPQASNGFNLSDDASCAFTRPTDKQNLAPLLGALANNGGPTQTRRPQSTSPLIDAVSLASCQADGAAGVTTDQRAFGRPHGPGCDIGAVESEFGEPRTPPTTMGA